MGPLLFVKKHYFNAIIYERLDMKKVIHRANDRGFADHGWLKAHHSFSFANWYDPEKVQFGKLRVLNDDIIAPDGGFGTHPHENMEIVTIPLEGDLAHEDNTGRSEVIKHNEVQAMSAGTGILHSEFNASEANSVNLLQIWIFPDRAGHEPRYDQKSFDPSVWKNQLHTIVSPDKSNNNLWLNQDAYFSRSDLDKDASIKYELHNNKNGLYLFLIDGVLSVTDEILTRRDAIGIWEIDNLEIIANEASSLLLIEVPMS